MDKLRELLCSALAGVEAVERDGDLHVDDLIRLQSVQFDVLSAIAVLDSYARKAM